MRSAGAWTIRVISLTMSVAITTSAEGVFRPRNGGLEGRLGASHLFLDTTGGGVPALVTGDWPALTSLARIEMCFLLRSPDRGEFEVRQQFDHDPTVIFLEEGQERLGIRARFKLYDRGNRYHGHGMTEIWAYPDGQVFVACAASFEGMAPAYLEDGVPLHIGKVTGAMKVMVAADPADRFAIASSAVVIDVAKTRPESAQAVQVLPFDDAHIPDRYVLANPDTPQAVGVYWRTGRCDSRNYINREQGDSPTYYQWPGFLIQAYGGHRLQQVQTSADRVRLDWLGDGAAPEPNAEFTAVFRLQAGAKPADLAAHVEAEREPLDLAVEGGAQHALKGILNGYNDQEGCYEILKTQEPVRVSIPAATSPRPLRLKIVGLSGHGAVQATLDGQPLPLQLSAEGGIADDPLAPIREAPEGPADMAVMSVPLTGAAQVLELREVAGVQLVYQRKDTARNVDCFTSHGDGRHAAFAFSLADGVLRRMRAYGQRDWALTENLMHWFSYCGFTPEQLLNELQDFEIIENGAAGAAFRYCSRNATGGAESEFIVRVPASPAAMRIDVTARFTVLDNWPYTGVQFFDVFPFRGVWPQDWWYDDVLWVTPDGRVKWLDTKSREFGGDKDLDTHSGPIFVALHSSARGNMVMLAHRFDPEVPGRYVICGNYVDFHMNLYFPGPDDKPAAPHQGDALRMAYELALWGDENTTREQLVELGRASLRAGQLTLDK